MKEGRADEAASGIERIQCHKIFEGTTISVFKGVCVCVSACAGFKSLDCVLQCGTLKERCGNEVWTTAAELSI